MQGREVQGLRVSLNTRLNNFDQVLQRNEGPKCQQTECKKRIARLQYEVDFLNVRVMSLSSCFDDQLAVSSSTSLSSGSSGVTIKDFAGFVGPFLSVLLFLLPFLGPRF